MTQNPLSSPDQPENSPGLPARRQVADVRRNPAVKVRSQLGSSPAHNDGISPAFFWFAFCQWWKLVVPIGLSLAIGAGLLVWQFYVPEFKATALVMIESNAPFIAFEGGNSSRDGHRYVQTQIELLRSPVVLSPVLSRPEIANMGEFKEQIDPLKYLQRQLTIKQIGSSDLYDVSYSGPSANDVATIANVVVAEYLLMHSREDVERTQLVIDVLEQERLGRSMNVERLRQRVVDLAKAITGKDPFGQGAVTDVSRALSPVAGLYHSLNEVDVSRAVLEAEIQALRDAPIVVSDQAEASGLLDLEIANRADVRELEAKIADIGDAMSYIKKLPRRKINETWETDPAFLRLEQESAETQTALADLKTTLRKELRAYRLSQRKAKHERLIATKLQELGFLNTRWSRLSEKFDEHLEELKTGGAQSTQLEFAKAELAREERVFELIAARKLALQTELRAPARVSLKQSASVPARSIEPIPFKLLLIACLASLVSPFAGAVLWETTIRRITSPEQLAQESLLPVLGEVARFPVRPVAAQPKRALPARQQREMFIFAESIDSLRTNLMLSENLGEKGQPRVIAIASAASGEGKTSVATSLAVSIAGATNKRTLLIDADLRSPDVAKVLGVTTKPGLAEVFAGKASLAEAIRPSGQRNTYVLPAGEHHVNPHHIIHGSRIDRLFDSLRAQFSTILVDTPPILGASESLVYSKAADLVLFCTLNKVSRAKQVRVAVERLQTTGANVAGAVLSGVPVGRYTYAYGNYGALRDQANVDS